MNTRVLTLACLGLFGLTSPPARAANVAIGGVASASTEAFGGFAALAIDGNRDGNYFNGSVSHTDNEDLAYWQVDLGTMKYVDSISLWNRTDAGPGCCTQRLSNVRISVLDSSLTEIWGTSILNDDPADYMRALAVPYNTQGRFVRVQSLPGLNFNGNNYIHLAEVEVYGNTTAPNIARNPLALATGSSVYEFGTPLSPDLAIDGSTDAFYGHRGLGNMFHSADSPDPLNPGSYRANAFWQVALGGDFAINEIDLFSRSDCCGNRQSNFRVSILNDGVEVWGQDYFTGGTAFLPSNNEAADQLGHLDLTGLNVTGDVVKVQQIGFNNEGNTPGGSSLMLGEVQVFGNAVPEPATFALALLGGCAVLLRRRR
jgi:hypothetical protein